MIFEQEAATLTVPHTRQGIHSLKVVLPFAGMTALCDDFRRTLSAVRAVEMKPDEARQLVRNVIGWAQRKCFTFYGNGNYCGKSRDPWVA